MQNIWKDCRWSSEAANNLSFNRISLKNCFVMCPLFSTGWVVMQYKFDSVFLAWVPAYIHKKCVCVQLALKSLPASVVFYNYWSILFWPRGHEQYELASALETHTYCTVQQGTRPHTHKLRDAHANTLRCTVPFVEMHTNIRVDKRCMDYILTPTSANIHYTSWQNCISNPPEIFCRMPPTKNLIFY